MKELKEYFCTLLEEQSDRTVLVLDSLDQLRDFGSKLKGWIPKKLPENVTMLLSCIPAEEFIVGPELKVRKNWISLSYNSQYKFEIFAV